jgi:hypothetical protein
MPAHAPPGFEILEELGRGGMGVVYRARQLSLGRECALKMILAGGHASEKERQRFLAEGEAAAALSHPNIVRVYESGTHQGLPWFALELCTGGTLAGKLRGQPLAPREAARLVEKLARAVQAAHSAGIVHRDLKPANVLLDEDGAPRIADFGLARRAGVDGLTGTNAIMGTPSYMAPEQAGGHSREAGPLADVWALGAILYECLVGKPPFRGTSTAETLMLVLRDDPSPPAGPRDLVTICLKCLQKEPGRRYASADALAEDLRRWSAGEPVAARPVGPAERLWLWMKRRPGVATLIGLLVLSVSAGLAFTIWFAVKSAADSHAARVALADMEASLADGLLRPMGHVGMHSELRGPEMEALHELAGLPPERRRVRILFLFRPLTRPRALEQLSRRLPLAVHAATGLDRGLAEEVTALAAERLASGSEDRNAQVALARMVALLEAATAEQAERAARALGSSLSEQISADELAARAEALVLLIGHRPPEAAQRQAEEVLASLRRPGELVRDAILLDLALAMAEPLPAEARERLAAEAGDLLMTRAKESEGGRLTGADGKMWARCAVRMGGFLTADARESLALGLLSSLPDSSDIAARAGEAISSLTPLSKTLGRPGAARFKARALAILGRQQTAGAMVWHLQILTRTLPLLAELPGGEQEQQKVADRVALEALTRAEKDGRDRGESLRLLSLAAPMTSSEAALRIAEDVLTLMRSESDTIHLESLAQIHAALAPRLSTSKRYSQAVLLAGLADTGGQPGWARWPLLMLTRLLPHLTQEEAERVSRMALSSFLGKMTRKPDPVLAGDFEPYLPALLQHLPREKAGQSAGELARIVADSTDPDLVSPLGLAAAPYLDEMQARSLASSLLRRIGSAERFHAEGMSKVIAAVLDRLGDGKPAALSALLTLAREHPLCAGLLAAVCKHLQEADEKVADEAFQLLERAVRHQENVGGKLLLLRPMIPLAAGSSSRFAEWLFLAEESMALASPHAFPTQEDHAEMVLTAVRGRRGEEEPLARFTVAYLASAQKLGPQGRELLGKLSRPGLLAVLRHPCCVGASRQMVMSECSRRSGSRVSTIWQAVEWLESTSP